jgi:VanZ family protein
MVSSCPLHALLGGMLFVAYLHNKKLAFINAFITLFILSGVDEIIQFFLPSRVGDVYDVFINIVAGGLGITLALLCFNKEKKSEN